MGIPFTAEINPRGNTTEERQAELIRQLRIQNEQLKRQFEDIDKRFHQIKKQIEEVKNGL